MKKIEELRVVDLRLELEIRGLDKTGVKAVLLERLQKAICAEGADPGEMGFDTSEQTNSSQLNLEDESAVDDKTTTDEDGNCTKLGKSLDNPTGEEDDSASTGQENASPGYAKGVKTAASTEEGVEETEDQFEEGLRDTEFQEEANTKGLDLLEDQDVLKEEKKQDEDEKSQEKISEDDYVRHIGDDSINLLLEDDDKMLDYEENDRNDLDETTALDGKDKSEGSSTEQKVVNGSSSTKDDMLSKQITDKNESGSNTLASSSKDGDSKITFDEKKQLSQFSGSRNLWVSGLSSNARAQDLKSLFTKHGKVVSAKIVTNAKTPGAKCYGFVTMSCQEEAAKCITHLNKTELNGRMIQIEKAKGEPGSGSKPASKPSSDGSSESEKKDGGDSTKDESRKAKKSRDEDGFKKDSSRDESRERRHGGQDARSKVSAKERVVDRRHERFSRHSPPKKDTLNLTRIVEERDRQRSRITDRLVREEERRQRDVEMRMKGIERRQREESERLSREREKLRMEREKIERQKKELLRMEREQQRIEREKLERERDELRKQQLKYEEVRRGVKRPSQDGRTDFATDRKRMRVPDSSNIRGGMSRGNERNRPTQEMGNDRGEHFERGDARYGRNNMASGSSRGGMRGGHHYGERREERRGSSGGRSVDRSEHRSGQASGPSRPSRDYNGAPSSNGPMEWRSNSSGGTTHQSKGTSYPASLMGNAMGPGRNMDNNTWRPPMSTNERWGGGNPTNRGGNVLPYRMSSQVALNSLSMMSNLLPTERFNMNNFRK